MKLVSSSEGKLREFKRFGLLNLEIEKGIDLKEVDSDAVTVTLYKALDAGVNRIVDDTSLDIEGENIGTNVRWLMDNLSSFDGRKATWRVLLGVNNGEEIILYEGKINGTIVHRFNELLGYGFESLFVPVGSDLTLYELDQQGRKDDYSARKRASDNMLNENIYYRKYIKDIPVWEGNYQNE